MDYKTILTNYIAAANATAGQIVYQPCDGLVKELKRKAAYITQDEHGKRVMEAQEIIKQEKQNAAECTLLLEALPDEKRKELQDYLEAFYVWCENQFRTTTDSSGGMHFHAPVGQVVANVEHQTLRSE